MAAANSFNHNDLKNSKRAKLVEHAIPADGPGVAEFIAAVRERFSEFESEHFIS